MSNSDAALQPKHFAFCAAGRPYTSAPVGCQTNYAGLVTDPPQIREDAITSLIQWKFLGLTNQTDAAHSACR
jgi:hypothetical protein